MPCVFAIGQADSTVKPSTIARHAERKHGRIERIRQPRRARMGDDENSDTEQGPTPKRRKVTLSDAALERIRDKNIEILAAGQLKSLDTFSKEEFKARDRQILREVGVDPTIADEIAVSRFTTRRDVVKIAERNREQIQLNLHKVAKNGGVGISFDHKDVNRNYVTNETSKVLGVSATITEMDGTRRSYLLGFPASYGEARLETVDLIEKVLDEYDILEPVQSGLITANSDYVLNSTARDLSFNNAVDPNHTIDRLLKRVTKELMPKFSQRCMVQFDKLKEVTSYAKKQMTKRELRSHPSDLEPSLNDYLKKKKASPIKTYTEVRFRSLHATVKSWMDVKPIMLDLVNDATNSNHIHVQNLPDYMYLEVLFDMMENAFVPLINFCDSQKTLQAGEYIAEVEFLLQWACSDNYANNEYGKDFKNCLVAAVMEQLIGSYIVDGREVKSQVWNRLLPNELAIMFGTFPRKNCLLEKIRFILKQSGRDKEAKLIKKFAKDNDFKSIAKEQFQKYDKLLNDPPEDNPSDSVIMNEFLESDDSDSEDQRSQREDQHSQCEDQRSQRSNRSRRSQRSQARQSASSSSSFVQPSAIDLELQKWNDLDQTFTKNFVTFAQTEGWKYKKSESGFIQQNQHNQNYWKGMVHILPRMSKIMLFLLQTPVSSSNLERYFSTISLNSHSIASRRDMEYLEEINQVHANTKKFFSALDKLSQ